MKSIFDQVLLHLKDRRSIGMAVVAIIPVLYGSFFLQAMQGQDSFAHWGLWVIGSALMFQRLVIEKSNKDSRKGGLLSWVALALAAIFAYLNSAVRTSFPIYLSLTLFFLFFSFIAYVWDDALGRKIVTPVAALFIFVPLFEPFRDWVVLLLRMVSARIAGLILILVGVADGVSGTQILLPGHSIAVTAACSGITMFESLIVLGWLIVLYLYHDPLQRGLHFSLLFPIIILVNSLRLIILIVGMLWIGEHVITGPFHLYLGYAVVILTVLLFLLSGGLVQEDK